VAFRRAGEIEETRNEFAKDAVVLDRLVARMERRQLDRDAWPCRKRAGSGRPADRLDRIGVLIEVALRVGSGAGAFTKHVVGMAKAALLHCAGASKRVADGFPEHKMVAEDPHRLARRRAHRRLAKPLDQSGKDALRRVAGLNDAARDTERPDRRGDEQLLPVAGMVVPVSAAELVLDQPILCRRIRHPQQGLRQHHEGKALPRRERELAEEILEPSDSAGALADCGNEGACPPVDPLFPCRIKMRRPDMLGDHGLIVRSVRSGEPEDRRFGGGHAPNLVLPPIAESRGLAYPATEIVEKTMRSAATLMFVVVLSALAGTCANQSGPYLKIAGGGFIFNYRLANAMLGILVVANRDLPENGAIEVSLTNPAGGPPLSQRAELTDGESQFDFRFESLTGIVKDVDYVATVRLLDGSGKEVEKLERLYRSDIDQAATMPDKPLTIGPGYTRNPDAAP
jgi:hypothetical protein